MFSDSMRVERNVFENNEIGADVMYAKGLQIARNIFRANHGAAGYGVGLEDVDSSQIRANRFEENRAFAVQFATRALPSIAGAPKLVDSAPLMAPPSGGPTGSAQRKPNPFAGLLALLAAIPLAAMRRGGRVRFHSARKARAPQITAAPAIVAQDVRKLYAGHRGVRDISLTVRSGESVALWGSNGAGKTTLLRCILGERLDAGTLRVFDHVPSPHDRAGRSLIGYAPQHLPDFDARVGEIAEMVAALRGADPSEAQRVLNLVQLAGERMRFVGELSGGMRQRLSVALALVGDPPLLLLDEPTAGLDRQSRESVIALLKRERARGKTLLFTSHLLEDVSALSDTVVTLECGSIVENASAQAFAAHYLRNIS